MPLVDASGQSGDGSRLCSTGNLLFAQYVARVDALRQSGELDKARVEITAPDKAIIVADVVELPEVPHAPIHR